MVHYGALETIFLAVVEASFGFLSIKVYLNLIELEKLPNQVRKENI